MHQHRALRLTLPCADGCPGRGGGWRELVVSHPHVRNALLVGMPVSLIAIPGDRP
jgi:hypothetical protein